MIKQIERELGVGWKRGSDHLPSAETLDPQTHTTSWSASLSNFRDIKVFWEHKVFPTWPYRAILGGILRPPEGGENSQPSGGPEPSGREVPTESRAGAPHFTPACPGVFLAPVMIFHILLLRIHRELCSRVERIWDNNIVAFIMV